MFHAIIIVALHVLFVRSSNGDSQGVSSGLLLGLYDDHRLFPAFFTAKLQGILGCATPLWPNFRPKIRQRDATVAGKVRARDTTMAGKYRLLFAL